MKLPAIAGGSAFAHLLGGQRPAAGKAKAEDDNEKRKDDDKDARKAEGGDDDDDDDDRKKDDDKDAKAEGGGDDDDDKKKDDDKDGKRGKAKADDDDDDDETDAKARSARLKERARCAAIFRSPQAAANIVGACHLAFDTGMSAKAAVGMLSAMAASHPPAPSPARRSIDERMSQQPNPDVGAGGDAPGPTGAAGAAAFILAANDKRHGREPKAAG